MLVRCRDVSKAVATGPGGDTSLRAIAALGGQLRRSLADSPETGRLEALERTILAARRFDEPRRMICTA